MKNHMSFLKAFWGHGIFYTIVFFALIACGLLVYAVNLLPSENQGGFIQYLFVVDEVNILLITTCSFLFSLLFGLLITFWKMKIPPNKDYMFL